MMELEGINLNRKEYLRKYREQNKEQLKKYMGTWHDKNREHEREYRKRRYRERKEEGIKKKRTQKAEVQVRQNWRALKKHIRKTKRNRIIRRIQ